MCTYNTDEYVQVGGSRALGEKMDIMELLESAGNSYLNQVLSFVYVDSPIL